MAQWPGIGAGGSSRYRAGRAVAAQARPKSSTTGTVHRHADAVAGALDRRAVDAEASARAFGVDGQGIEQFLCNDQGHEHVDEQHRRQGHGFGLGYPKQKSVGGGWSGVNEEVVARDCCRVSSRNPAPSTWRPLPARMRRLCASRRMPVSPMYCRCRAAGVNQFLKVQRARRHFTTLVRLLSRQPEAAITSQQRGQPRYSAGIVL